MKRLARSSLARIHFRKAEYDDDHNRAEDHALPARRQQFCQRPSPAAGCERPADHFATLRRFVGSLGTTAEAVRDRCLVGAESRCLLSRLSSPWS